MSSLDLHLQDYYGSLGTPLGSSVFLQRLSCGRRRCGSLDRRRKLHRFLLRYPLLLATEIERRRGGVVCIFSQWSVAEPSIQDSWCRAWFQEASSLLPGAQG